MRVYRRILASTTPIALEMAALLALGVFTVIFYRSVIFQDRIFIGNHVTTTVFPRFAFIGESLRAGRMPLWNPYAGLGLPFLSDPSNAVLYPASFLASLLAPEVLFGMLVALHAFLGGWFAYAAARSIGHVNRPAAIGAGLIFGFGGFLSAQVSNINVMMASAWMPAAFLLMYRVCTRWNLAAAVGVAVVVALQFYAGAPHVSLITIIFLISFAVAFIVSTSRIPLWKLTLAIGRDGFSSTIIPDSLRLGRVSAMPLILVIFVALLSFTLMQAQWLPYLEWLREVQPQRVGLRQIQMTSIPQSEMLRTILPEYAEWTGHTTAYVGFLAMALAGLGTIRRIHRGLTWFLVGVAGASIALAFGDPIILAPTSWILPGFSGSYDGAVWLGPFTLAVALLAGFGINEFARPQTTRGRIRVATAVVGAVMAPAGALVLAFGLSGGLTGMPAEAVTELWVGLAIVLIDLVFILALLPAWRAVGYGVLVLLALELLATGTLPGIQPSALESFPRPLYLEVQAKNGVDSLPDITSGERTLIRASDRAVAPTVADLPFISQTRMNERDAERYLNLLTELRSVEQDLIVIPPSRLVFPTHPLHGEGVPASYAAWLKLWHDGSAEIEVDDSPTAGEAPRILTGNEIPFPDSKALSLGAVRYVIQEAGAQFRANGVQFSLDTTVILPPGSEITFPVQSTSQMTSIQPVTALSEAADIEEGENVIEMTVTTSEGNSVTGTLRAGIETAVEPYPTDRTVRHSMPAAAVFDSNTGKLYGYLSRLPTGLPARAVSIRVRNLTKSGVVRIRAINLVDDRFQSGQSVSLNPNYELARPDTPSVLKNRLVRPRAALVGSYDVVEPGQGLSSAMDLPLTVVAIEAGRDKEITSLAANSAVSLGSTPADFGRPDRVAVKTSSSSPAMLVISDLDYPGWTATLDGKPAPVLRANGLVRAVEVPAGEHSVTMVYAPESFAVGLRRTMTGLAAAGVVLAFWVVYEIVRIRIAHRLVCSSPVDTEASDDERTLEEPAG